MDKRWKLSQFAGLPPDFVAFAKRLDLTYDKKRQVLRDRIDDEPVAWLLENVERRISQMAGVSVLEVVVWHPEGEAKLSWADLKKIRNRSDLLEFQGKSLKKTDTAALSIEDVLEDAKQRALKKTSYAGSDTPVLEVALKELGTVGKEDMIEEFPPGAACFRDVFENITPISENDILPDAARDWSGKPTRKNRSNGQEN